MKLHRTFVGLGIVAGLSGTALANLNVLTTTPDLASIVKEVGKDKVSVSAIVVGARDPHRIEAKPSYMSRAAQAHLWVSIGLDLEIAYERPIIDGSRNPRIRPGTKGYVNAANWVKVLEIPASVSRAEGDVHPGGNPHVWLDPFNGRIIAQRLAERMGELDPPQAATYRANAVAFVRRIDDAMFGKALVGKHGGDALWAWENGGRLIQELTSRGELASLSGWEGAMRPFRGAPVITYHKSWPYFVARFGLKVIDYLEPKPGLDPTPGHVAHVIEEVKASGVKLILQEPIYSTRNANFVASRTSAKVVVVPGNVGHTSDAKDYISLFDSIIKRISEALSR